MSSDTSICCDVVVAPYRGAWIEICGVSGVELLRLVAPYRGAWIEILSSD